MNRGYRVYSHKKKRFIESAVLLPSGEISFPKNTFSGMERATVDEEDYTLTFDTGFDDKNLTEIFEGDILLFDGNMRIFVEWDNNEAKFNFRKNWTDKILYPPYNFEHATIIGNIFENPELTIKP